MKEKIREFYQLDVWKMGHEMVLEILKITKTFPKEEIYILVSQMRRAAISVTSNIAEGFSRRTPKDKMHFYTIAAGSLTELYNQLFICRDTGYLSPEVFVDLEKRIITILKCLNALIASIRSRTGQPQSPATNP